MHGGAGVSGGDPGAWAELTEFSDSYTCYSSALATWAALGEPTGAWPALLNPGLWLAIVADGPLRFGFSHFEPGLRARLGLARTGAGGPAREAVDGILAELERSGRVIVAGDGFNLPWHVAHTRRHVPHWYVLTGGPDGLEVLDPFACRNELGLQAATRRSVRRDELAALLPALPREDPVLALREVFALGAPEPADARPWQWFTATAVSPDAPAFAPDGEGAAAIRRLAGHFRAHGQTLAAYAQADDLWSVGRHRGFLARRALTVAEDRGDPELARWASEHAQPLAKRWGHVAPLIMQATLALAAGRSASASLPDTLEDLAERERAADRAFPGDGRPDSI